MGAPAIRLLVSDIDGTLVRRDKTLSDANRDAIRALEAAGVPVTLISARPPSGIFALAQALGIKGPLGAFNGGTLFDADGTVRFAHRLAADDAASALKLAAVPGISRWAFADGLWFAEHIDNPHVPSERKSAAQEPVIRADFADLGNRIDKIVCVSDDSALLDQAEASIKSAIGPRATIARSQSYYLDVTHPFANKGDGISALADAYGIELSAVAAFGDMDNDLPMFARAGFSVAMGQASETVRSAATAVAASNEDDGVADAIQRFIRPRLGSV